MRLFIITLLLGSATLYPLSAQISGQVFLSEDGQKSPAVGAEVYWKNTQVGTTTNANGFFEIERSEKSNVLVVQMIGFKAQEKIIISRKGKTNFTLEPESTELATVEVQGKTKATLIDAKAAELNYKIDQGELRKAACCNLSESFETNASVDVAFTDAVTGTKQIEMLGLSGKYSLIQRENIPLIRGLNSSSGLSFIPGPFIESIQLTKGLSSVINGYESLTGQINVEFHKPESGPQVLVNAYLNQGARSELNVINNEQIRPGLEYGSMIHLSTIPIAQDRNNDGFADLTTGSQINVVQKLHYHNENGWEGQFGLNFLNDQREGGQISAINDQNPGAWSYQNTNRSIEVFGKNGYVFQDEALRNIGLIYSFRRQDLSTQFGNRNINAEQTSFYFNSILHDMLVDTRHQFRTGLSFQYDRINQALDSLQNPQIADNREELVPGAFFEYTFEPNELFTMVAGVRTDYNSYFEEAFFTPRLHIRYALSENTTFRLGGGRGQRTANAIIEHAPLLASSRAFRYGNLAQNRLPEIAWNGGFSVDQIIPIGEKVLRLTGDVFYTYFENKVIADLDRDPRWAFLLMDGGSRSLAAMIQADFSPTEGFDLRLAYKHLNAIDPFLDGENLSYGVPKHRAFINLSYATNSNWKFDLTQNWFGAKRLPNTDLSPTEFQREDFSPHFFITNLQVNKTHKRWEFFGGIENLLNFRQSDPIVNAQAPFSPYFDSNLVWGPIFGRNIYLGLYYQLDHD